MGQVLNSFWALWTEFIHEKMYEKFEGAKFADPFGRHKVKFEPGGDGVGDFLEVVSLLGLKIIHL